MDKITYLAELAEGLARWVPERERQDILRYYAEYFDEAGPGKEAEVIQELGDPWALSCRLAVEGGYVSQEAANSWVPPRKRTKVWPFVLAGTVACVAIVAVSVGMLASRVGRAVGSFVGGLPENEVSIVDAEEYGFVPVEGVPGAFVYEENDEVRTSGFWSMEDGCLEMFDTIDAEIGLGSVTVSPGDDYTLYIGYEGDLGGYKVTWEVRDGTLKIRSSGSRNIDGLDELVNLFGNGGTMNVSVDITVPEEVLLEKLSIVTGTGSVMLSDVAAEKVTVGSGTGSVKCYNPRQVSMLKMETGTGNVTLWIEELYSGVEIELESGTGSIKADLNCSEQDCAYELETGTGKVKINNESRGHEAERKSNAAFYKLEAESGTGSVNVNFTEN